MSRPRPEDYPTLGTFLWARHLWRRRTGGSLLATVALAALVGALSGSAVVVIVLVCGGLALHLYVRHARG